MNIAQIENNISNLVKKIRPETFIYDFLLAYGLPQASITRLQKGNLNLSKRSGEVSWKRKVLFREEYKKDLHLAATALVKEAVHDQRFVIVTDYKSLLAVDTKTNVKLDTSFEGLHKHFDFFLPWAGMEKSQHHGENPADVKAAEKMAKLFDEIKRDNPSGSPEFIHNLNVFLSRLLFCYFAEDTNIFEKGQFLNAISSHTQADGSDLGVYLDKLFNVLNTPVKDRRNLPAFLNAFPYVNGGLFKSSLKSPLFTRRSRQAVIDCGDMDWAEINPDIFGSMMQAVVTPESRGGLGMHYTSVPNIMKVIRPLFLDDLYEEFEKAKGNLKRLNDLLTRIYKLKLFDPACGSGNFLIVAYKELRKLEMKIFKAGNMMPMSRISLSQFYGIEIDDFAHGIAQLSLWLAEHQMHLEFYNEFGRTNPTLPLKETATIVCANACRIDWTTICPLTNDSEVYVLGNPPYLGARQQSDEQKRDIEIALANLPGRNNLDYISIWFYKAHIFIKNTNAIAAFVSTNSICQGEQVPLLWQYILNDNIEIGFAHLSFKWENNAKQNAAVICIIVCIRNISQKPKYLFNNGLQSRVHNINAYLLDANNNYIEKRNSPISAFVPINYGSFALDDGNYTLSEQEMLEITNSDIKAKQFIQEFIGAKELLQGVKRYCVWLLGAVQRDVIACKPIYERVVKVKKWREESDRKNTKELAETPMLFAEIRQPACDYLAFPTVSSERRVYMPAKYLPANIVASNQIYIIPNAPAFLFSVLSSYMHNLWIKTVGGRIKLDYRYSAAICYNTFPFPMVNDKRREELTRSALRILEERERYSNKTLAELYDPEEMPSTLKEAHLANDVIIEACYRSKPFISDEERLQHLFNLYEQMSSEEQNKGTLFEMKSKPKRGN